MHKRKERERKKKTKNKTKKKKRRQSPSSNKNTTSTTKEDINTVRNTCSHLWWLPSSHCGLVGPTWTWQTRGWPSTQTGSGPLNRRWCISLWDWTHTHLVFSTIPANQDLRRGQVQKGDMTDLVRVTAGVCQMRGDPAHCTVKSSWSPTSRQKGKRSLDMAKWRLGVGLGWRGGGHSASSWIFNILLTHQGFLSTNNTFKILLYQGKNKTSNQITRKTLAATTDTTQSEYTVSPI